MSSAQMVKQNPKKGSFIISKAQSQFLSCLQQRKYNRNDQQSIQPTSLRSSTTNVQKVRDRSLLTQQLDISQQLYENKEKAGNFTDRISELIKMRQQHQQIIRKLTGRCITNAESAVRGESAFRKKTRQSQNQCSSEKLMLISKTEDVYQGSTNKKYQREKVQVRYQNIMQTFHNNQESINCDKRSICVSDPKPRKSSVNGNGSLSRQVIKNYQAKLIPEFQNIIIQSSAPSNIHKGEGIHQLEIAQSSRSTESRFEVESHVNLAASLLQFNKQTSNSTTDTHSTPQKGGVLFRSIFDLLHQSGISQSFEQLEVCLNSCEDDSKLLDQHYMNLKLNSKVVQNGFLEVVCYLNYNQMWEGLFWSLQCEDEKGDERGNGNQNQNDSEQYWGLCFEGGRYSEILLSETPLTYEQKSLLVFQLTAEKSKVVVNVSYVLLWRILKGVTTFPEMLNRLFGYPYISFKTEDIFQITELKQFCDRLREIHSKEAQLSIRINDEKMSLQDKEKSSSKRSMVSRNSSQKAQSSRSMSTSEHNQLSGGMCSFSIWGRLRQNSSSISRGRQFEPVHCGLLNLPKYSDRQLTLYEFRELMRSEEYLERFNKKYDGVVVMNHQQLPVKSITLTHSHNHFVVLTLNAAEEGLHFVGIKSCGNDNNDSDMNMNSNKAQLKRRFRVCLISTGGTAVGAPRNTILDCFIIADGESFPLYLPADDYELYISSIFHPQAHLREEENFEFMVQSQHLTAKTDHLSKVIEQRQFEFEIRFRHCYKSYTQMIIEQYLESSFLEREILSFFGVEQKDGNQSDRVEKSQKQKKITSQVDQNNQKNVHNQQSLKFHKSDKSYPQTIQEIKESEEYSDQKIKSSVTSRNNPSKTLTTVLNWKQLAETVIQNSTHLQSDFRLIILRVQIKALNLFVDAINVPCCEKTDSWNLPQIKYEWDSVLVDENCKKNTVELEFGKINLIYLSKNSPIRGAFMIRRETIRSQVKQIEEQIDLVYDFHFKKW